MTDPHAVYLAMTAITAMQIAVKQQNILKAAAARKTDDNDTDTKGTNKFKNLATVVKGIARFQTFKRQGEFSDSTVRRRQPRSPSRTPTNGNSFNDLTTNEIPETSFKSAVLKTGKVGKHQPNMNLRSNAPKPTQRRQVTSRQDSRRPASKTAPAFASPPIIRKDKSGMSAKGAHAPDCTENTPNLQVTRTNPHFEQVKRSVLTAMDNDENKLTLRRSHIHSFSIE